MSRNERNGAGEFRARGPRVRSAGRRPPSRGPLPSRGPPPRPAFPGAPAFPGTPAFPGAPLPLRRATSSRREPRDRTVARAPGFTGRCRARGGKRPLAELGAGMQTGRGQWWGAGPAGVARHAGADRGRRPALRRPRSALPRGRTEHTPPQRGARSPPWWSRCALTWVWRIPSCAGRRLKINLKNRTATGASRKGRGRTVNMGDQTGRGLGPGCPGPWMWASGWECHIGPRQRGTRRKRSGCA